MITLISIIGALLLVTICAAVHLAYKARFGTAILILNGAVFVYLGAATSAAVVWGMRDMVGPTIDVLLGIPSIFVKIEKGISIVEG